MTTNNQSLTERISARLDVLNQRLVARLRRNRELLENMRTEEKFRKNMGYLKGCFRFKGGN